LIADAHGSVTQIPASSIYLLYDAWHALSYTISIDNISSPSQTIFLRRRKQYSFSLFNKVLLDILVPWYFSYSLLSYMNSFSENSLWLYLPYKKWQCFNWVGSREDKRTMAKFLLQYSSHAYALYDMCIAFCMRVFSTVLYACIQFCMYMWFCMRVFGFVSVYLLLYACIRFCVRVFGFVCVFAHLSHPTKDNRSSFRKREIIDHCITGCGSKLS
jgi:hypothetical protein